MARNALAAVLSWVSSLSTRGTCVASCFPHQGMNPCSALGERFPRESGVFLPFVSAEKLLFAQTANMYCIRTKSVLA